MNNPLDRIFGRFFTATTTKPYGLPIFKTFIAPADVVKFDAFFATYKAIGWQLEEALIPYADDEQVGTVAFYDPVTDGYMFCPTLRFCRLNGIHVEIVPADNE